MYDDISFIRKVESLERKGLLGGERKIYSQEYSEVHSIPLNKITMNFYNRIDEKVRKKCNPFTLKKGRKPLFLTFRHL